MVGVSSYKAKSGPTYTHTKNSGISGISRIPTPNQSVPGQSLPLGPLEAPPVAGIEPGAAERVCIYEATGAKRWIIS